MMALEAVLGLKLDLASVLYLLAVNSHLPCLSLPLFALTCLACLCRCFCSPALPIIVHGSEASVATTSQK